MKRLPILLFGVAILAVGVFVLVYCSFGRSNVSTAGGGAAPAENPSASDDGARLRDEIAVLRSEVRFMRGQLQESAASDRGRTGAAGRAIDVPEKAEPRKQPESLAEAETKHKEAIARIESSFRNEAKDPAWATGATTAIQNALHAEGVGLTVRRMECRSRTCRVEIPDDGSGSLMKSYPLLAVQLAETLPSITADRVEEPNGGVTMVLYLTRPE